MQQSIAFDRAAGFYDETRGFPPGTEAPIAAMIQAAGELAATSRVLEIGVGTGRVALPLAALLERMYGIDLAVPMLERLRAKRTTEPVEVAQADATRLPFAPGTFDAVLAVHVFHLIPNWQDALSEVARVLTDDGVLLNTFSINFHRDEWWEAWNEVVQDYRRDPNRVAFGRHRTFLSEIGWQPRGDERSYRYTYERTPNQFIDSLRQRLWSSTWLVSDDDLERGVAAVRAAMTGKHDDLDAPVEIHTDVVVQAFAPPR